MASSTWVSGLTCSKAVGAQLQSLKVVLATQILMLHAHADLAQPFDFLLNGELVRQPLEEMVLGQGLSTVGLQITRCLLLQCRAWLQLL